MPEVITVIIKGITISEGIVGGFLIPGNPYAWEIRDPTTGAIRHAASQNPFYCMSCWLQVGDSAAEWRRHRQSKGHVIKSSYFAPGNGYIRNLTLPIGLNPERCFPVTRPNVKQN